MTYLRPARRLATTLRTLTFPKINQSTLREVLALSITSLMLLQPMVGAARSINRAETRERHVDYKATAANLTAGMGMPFNSTAQSFPFSQPWTNTGLITANDNWTGVPGIEGYFLNSTNSTTGIDPQTVLTDTFNGATTTVDLDVVANQTNSTNTAGGVLEIHTSSQAAPANANPTIAFQGSATADAPFLLLHLNTTGWSSVNVSYNLRDLDCSTDDATQAVALQFRVGNSGAYTNVPLGFVADATARTNAGAVDTANCTLVTAVNTTLPAAANNQSLVQVRILTTNAAGNDEMVGIDDISLTASPLLNISDDSVLETNAGTTTANFTVSLPAPAGPGGVTFDIATADGTAQDANPVAEDNDYVAKSLTGQTIPEGSSSYGFNVTVNGDTFIEPNETFFVNVTNITGAVAGDAQGQGTIQNDDSPPDLSITDVTAAETNAGTTTFTFQVSLSAPATGGGVTFDIATADGTAQDDNPATEDNDYVAKSLTGQTILAGASTYDFSVTVNGDAVFEGDETFFVNVTNITGANSLDSQGLGTIQNDEAQPSLSIADATVIEGNAGTQLMTFTVTLSGAAQDTVSVNYATADSSATTANSDYDTASGPLIFVSGDTSESFTVTINGDTNPEGDEEFFVNLSGATVATIADPQALGIIFLDDALSISAANTPFTENFNVLSPSATASVTTPAAWTRAESGTNANNTYTADNGFLNAGNTYSYGATSDPDRALGGLQSGSLIPTIGAFFRNDTGATITTLLVSYTGEEWRFGATGRTDRLDFQYSTNATSLTTGTWTDVNTLDFTSPFTSSNAGDIGQRDGNAAANRTNISNLISGLSIPAGATFWIRWNDSNASGADDGLAVDDFSITTNAVLPDTAPTVSTTTPADNATNVPVSSNVTITFSEAVNVSGAFGISCASSGVHTFVSSTSDNITFTLNPDTDFSSNEVCTITVLATGVTDQDGDDPPDNMAADYTFDFTTVDVSACGSSFTPIYTIQGSGATTPIPGAATTEGIVVGDFQGSTGLSGFYIQDPTGDANTATSDGLFVFDGASPAVAVNVGDRVRVSGTVAEAFGNTQITPTGIIVCSTGNSLPAATVYDLPEPADNDLERVENMLVTFPETLTVTGNFTWGRFGELVLSSDARMFQQNSFDRPNTAGALARASLNARAYIYLDDGSSVQNPNPIPYQSPDNTRRAGDTVTGLTGILTFDFSQYRLQPTGAVTFAQANPRPVSPASVGGNLKVSSANVLNYFNGDGAGGGFPTSRGADTLAEFNRQRAKVIAEIVAVNADVIGIIEMENDGGGATSALQDLVNGLNAATAPGTYVGLHSPNPGTDLIQNAIIYKPASVTPVGAQVNDINSAWDQARAPLAQTFQHNGNSEKFTFIVNHFTSKGCSASDTGIDADMGDGQGCDNGQRQIQANRLLVFIQDRKTASGDPDVLSMGDYNAYGEEDPLFILEQDASDTLADGTGGLVNESKHFLPMADRYSFQFGNQFGELDHAYATKSMNFQVSGATIFHINADEPVAIDYNTEFKTQDLYAPTPYRAADHDPLIIGLNLTATPPQAAGSLIVSEFRFRGPGGSQDEFVELYNNTNADITVATTDGSAGWTVVASNGSEVCRVNNTTVIPARGHFLCTNISYSLTNYGGPGGALLDVGFNIADIPDGAGIALFRSNNPANYTLAERLDAVGYASVNSLYREGAGFQTGAPGAEIGGNIEYSFLRTMTRATNGQPKDTGDNVADFIGVATNGSATSIGQNLGAPGPENLASPTNRNAQFTGALLDPAVSSSSPPNRVRNLTVVPNGDNGTMSVRRTFTNNTGAPVTRLRFRIVEVTTFINPVVPGQADLRALTSGDTTATVTGVGTVNVLGTTLEEPPTQGIGGGWNSTLNVPSVDGGGPPALGTIELNAPLNVGQSINVQFMLGVMTPGRFLFFLNIEAENGCASPPAAGPLEPCAAITKPLQRRGSRP